MAKERTLEHVLLAEEQSQPILAPSERVGKKEFLVMSDWRQTIGALLLAAAVVVVSVAWWGLSGTTDTSSQLSYILSGGMGGAVLLVFGVVLMVASEHSRDRAAVRELDAHLRQFEERHAGQLSQLYGALGNGQLREPSVEQDAPRR